MSNDAFVGAGWAFPMRTQANGSITLAHGDRKLAESIWLILSTAPGERPMRPTFGCALNEFVFAQADTATAAGIVSAVRSAIDFWEPRVVVDDVQVEFHNVERGELHILLTYRRRDTNTARNLVFPFFVVPPSNDPTEGEP